jgi:hypothetical protein
MKEITNQCVNKYSLWEIIRDKEEKSNVPLCQRPML